MRAIRFAALLLLGGLIGPVEIHAQDAGIRIFEPLEWDADRPRPFAAPAGTSIRVRGVAFHPQGIRRLLINGQPVGDRRADEFGGEEFTAFVQVAPGQTTLDVVVEPNEGDPIRRSFPLTVEGGAPQGRGVEENPPLTTLYDPGTAMLRGLLIPGLGQFYTQRPGRGMLVLGGAVAAVAAGFALSKGDTVECNEFNECHTVESGSSLVVPGILAGLAIGIIGALEARSYAAKSTIAEDPDSSGRTGGLRLRPPALGAGPDGLRLHLLRARF